GGTEAFESSSAPTTLDFSQVYNPCPSAPAPCVLTINGSGADLASPSLDDFNAEITASGTIQTTYDFSTGGSHLTGFVGLASGPTSFYGEAATYTMSDLLSGSQIIAGDGTETYTVAANGTTFTSGGASDTFTVTGNNNTSQAASGPDTFYDTVPGGGGPPVNT